MCFIPDETCGICYKDSPSTQMFQCAHSSFSEMPLSVQGACCQQEGYDTGLDGRPGGACLHPVLLELTQSLAALMPVDKRNLKQFQKPAEPARSLQNKGDRRLVQSQIFTYTAAFLSPASGSVY